MLEHEAEEAPRDPVNCRACLIDWLRETRAMLDAIERGLDVAPTVADVHEGRAH